MTTTTVDRKGGIYTIHEDPAVDARVQSDLDRISAHIQARYPNTIALVLVGGFGRGEGGVLIEGDEIRPLNDYDFVLVTRSAADGESISKSRSELARELGIDWVDIVNYSLDKLPNLPPTQFNFDLRHSGRVVLGDENVLDQIPDWQASEIPVGEAERLCFTRLWCFLGGYQLEFERRTPSATESFFLMGQLSKALLAHQDAHLLLIGAYDTSYRARAEIFRSEFKNQRENFELLEMANDWKLSPSSRPPLSPMSIFNRVRDLYLETCYRVGTSRYERPIRDSHGYQQAYLGNWEHRLKRWVGRARGNQHQHRTQLVNAAQLHLLADHADVVEAKQRDQDYRGDASMRAAQLLKALAPDRQIPGDWDGLRALAAELRMQV